MVKESDPGFKYTQERGFHSKFKNMCKACYNNEILRFETQQDFNVFYSELQIKISIGTLIFNGTFDGDFTPPKFELFGLGVGSKIIHDYDEYECSICKQKWKLSMPENAWRGFLLKSENYY